MNNHRFTFHEDSGHGWLQVPASEIIKLQLDDEITPYSYMGCHPRDLHKGSHNVYLEEDQDMGTFLEAYRRAYGGDPQGIINKYSNASPIRNFPSYRSYFSYRVGEYLRYVMVDRIVNDGHVLLQKLWDDFGKDRVNAKLSTIQYQHPA